MHLKVLFTKVVYVYRCCGACGLIVATSKWQKIVMRGSKKELEDWHKNGSEDRAKMPSEVRGENDEYEKRISG